MKTGMKAIIKKDMHTITKNKRMFSTLFIVPLVLTVFLPTVMLLAVFFAPSEASDFEKLLQLLPFQYQGENFSLAVIDAIFNYILPIFFLIIPIMVASIMAATSFTGEKEKHTLETLLYCPLSLKEIFRAKVLASFILSMLVSLISFAIMLIVLETEMFFIADHLLIPDFNWLIILLLVPCHINDSDYTYSTSICQITKRRRRAAESGFFGSPHSFAHRRPVGRRIVNRSLDIADIRMRIRCYRIDFIEKSYGKIQLRTLSAISHILLNLLDNNVGNSHTGYCSQRRQYESQTKHTITYRLFSLEFSRL